MRNKESSKLKTGSKLKYFSNITKRSFETKIHRKIDIDIDSLDLSNNQGKDMKDKLKVRSNSIAAIEFTFKGQQD
jgi:hypothetical protein